VIPASPLPRRRITPGITHPVQKTAISEVSYRTQRNFSNDDFSSLTSKQERKEGQDGRPYQVEKYARPGHREIKGTPHAMDDGVRRSPVAYVSQCGNEWQDDAEEDIEGRALPARRQDWSAATRGGGGGGDFVSGNRKPEEVHGNTKDSRERAERTCELKLEKNATRDGCDKFQSPKPSSKQKNVSLTPLDSLHHPGARSTVSLAHITPPTAWRRQRSQSQESRIDVLKSFSRAWCARGKRSSTTPKKLNTIKAYAGIGPLAQSATRKEETHP
jgi:hypothetical protein